MDQAIAETTGHSGAVPAATREQTTPPEQNSSGSAKTQHDHEQRHVYAGREWGSDHSLNIRVSIPLGIGRYYITIIAGKERRARARLALNRKQHPLTTPGNLLFLAFVTIIAVAGSATVFYMLLAHIFSWSGRFVF